MFRRLLRDYLSLTRGERRGLQFLSFLVLLLILFRTFLPVLIHPVDPGVYQFGAGFIAFRDSIQRHNELYAVNNTGIRRPAELVPPVELFRFDPNTARQKELLSLGVSERTARTLVNYREAGGEFNVDSDLLKIYGMEPELFSLLKPYIHIPEKKNDPDAKPGLDGADINITLFELNTADSIQLISVYGIGPTFAHRIIRYRELLGGFYSRAQLMEVYGFTMEQRLELFRRSFIDTSIIRKMDMNSKKVDDFRRHPYLDHYQSVALVKYRELIGDFEYRIQILENGLLPDSIYQKVRPYLEVEN